MYYKLLLFFMILAIAIVFVLSVAFLNIYKNALLGEITAAYERDMKTKAIEIDKLVEEIDYVYMSVISDDNVIKFMSMDTWNPMDEYLVKRRFARFRNIHSRVLSMYLYNGALGYFVSTDSEGRDYADFPDHEVIEGIKQRRLITIRRTPSGQDASERVFSFIYSTFSPRNGKLENSVIINLDDPINSESVGVSGLSDMIILDAGFHPLTTASRKPAAGPEEWSFIDGPLGSRTAESGFGTHIISYSKIESLGWYLVGIYEYNTMSKAIQGKMNYVLYTALAALLLSTVLIYILSRIIYFPVETFIRKVNKSPYGRIMNEKRKSELDYLMDSFTEMLEKIEQTQKDNKKHLAGLKEYFYRRVLIGVNDESVLYEQAEEYGVAMDCKYFRVIVFKIDGYYSINQSYRNLHETSICQITGNLLRRQFNAVVVSIHEGEAAAIISGMFPGEMDGLKNILADIQTTVFNTLNQSITIGIGVVAGTLGEIHSSCETAEAMAGHRLTLGFGQIIDSPPNTAENRAPYPDEAETGLIETMRLGSKDSFTGHAEQLLAYLKSLEHRTAKLYLMQISLTLIRSINSPAGRSSETFILDKIIKSFDELETLNQAASLLSGLFDEYQRIMKEINLGSSYNNMISIISQAKNYIREKFREPNLNIDLIADQFGYTATYFAKIFRDVTGEFITDFIRECRISRAKNLLTGTGLSVAEVAVLSGYNNTNYFFYAFKKYTGLTPSAYRSSHGKQAS